LAYNPQTAHAATIHAEDRSFAMTRVSFQVPASIHQRAKLLAKRDGISLDQLMASALAEKVSVLETVDYLRQRAARGSRQKFKDILANVPTRKPLKGDELPSRKNGVG
jgi:hypothetical protein